MKSAILDRIRELHRAEPFHPFAISFADGRRIEIDRPEFLGIFSSEDRIFYSTPEDATEVAEISKVVRVDRAARRRGRGRA
jgi:hypothetical protein